MRRRPPILALVLLWLAAALVAPPAALALGAVADGPRAAVDPGDALGSRSAPPPAEPGREGRARVPPLRLPVQGPLARGYEAPAGPYGAGHRGVDLAAAPGAPVLAPAAGTVVFAGKVAGTVWASLQLAPGVLVTLGPLWSPIVTKGQRVAGGTRIAGLAPGHGTARYPTTLHLGLRLDGVYVDPLPWLTGLGRPRLAPLLEPGGPH
jgi:murein DD-endopeptidase MepM/ murein hydrolase activator NlpD